MSYCRPAGDSLCGQMLSRRTVVGVASAAALTSGSNAGARDADEARETCLRYVEMEDQVLSLLDEWPTLESRLAREYPDFLGRPIEQQALFPGGARFLEIERELDRLDIEREKLLPVVLKLKCKTPDAVIAKLMVVERLIQPDDHPEAHKLVADSVADLHRLLSA